MNKKEYIFGANILENLTTGMYQDSKVIYREYIQNACDQIDKAIQSGLLRHGEGIIEIWLDHQSRTISIEDNATGIPAKDFQRVLGNIADSDKEIGKDKGFRGIGRLCGLAYCKEVVFTSKAKGEDVISIMRCDAKKMRQLIFENGKRQKLTASEVLHQINKFSVEPTSEIDEHYFKVELIGINDENTDLLNKEEIRDYLSFVAPIPYQNTFIFRTTIYEHAEKLMLPIDEYTIKLDGKQLFKNFRTTLKKSDYTNYDEVFNIECIDFLDDNGVLFAWMWVGLTKFTNAIPRVNKMRGIRLRKENIQIGGEDALQKLFKEDRGNSYFVGEVFAISSDLVPNSQRDYFNENPMRAYFELKLRRFFNEELHKLYYDGSAVNSAIKKITTYEEKHAEFVEKQKNGSFVSEDHKDNELKKLEKAKEEAASAKKRIERVKEKASEKPDGLMEKVIKRIEDDLPPKLSVKNLPQDKENYKQKRRTDNPRLSSFSKRERKLISKIFDIIVSATDSKTSEAIICKIEDGLLQ